MDKALSADINDTTLAVYIYKYLFVFSAIVCARHSWCQGLIVYKRAPVAYTYFDNTQRFVVPGVGAEKIRFTTDNGTVDKSGDMILFRPVDTGKVTLTAWVGKKKAGTVEMAVGQKTEANIYYGGKESGAMKADVFIAQGGVVARMYVNDWHAEPVRVLSYSVLLVRNNQIVACRVNQGNRFEEETKKFIITIQPGDVVVFANVQLQPLGNIKIYAKPAEFIIE